MHVIQGLLSLVARLMITAIFLSSAVMNKIPQFNAVAAPSRGRYEFAVKAAAFRGDIADAPRLWQDHDAGGSRSNLSVDADADPLTWQRVATPLVVPPDADFLVIECAVVFKGPEKAHGATEFPGHYVDQVEVRLSASPRSWTEPRNRD